MHYGDLSIGKNRGAAQKDSCDMTEAEAKEAVDVEWQGWSATGRPVASHYIDDCYVSTLDTFENHLEAIAVSSSAWRLWGLELEWTRWSLHKASYKI